MPPPPGFASGGSWPPVPPGHDPGRRRAAFLIATVLIASSVFGAWQLARDASDSASPSSPAASGQVEGDRSASAIGRQVNPAVVDINTFARVFGNPLGNMAPLGAGTGMILTPTGEVLTNNHVVDGAWKIEVSITGRRGTATATVIGVDPSADVALIQLQGVSGLPTVTPAAASVAVGDRVLGIGNALGRGGAPSVAVGSVSGIDRTIKAKVPGGDPEQLSGMIATNAQIQPGDSGGPLVDTNGRVVGMITAGGANKQGPITGFAIPFDTALGIIDRIRAGDDNPPIYLGDRGHIGIAVDDVDAHTAHRLGVTSGALVVGVDPGGPAADAGITVPSVITSIGGNAVSSKESLGLVLHSFLPGEHVVVKWVDASGTHSRTVLLDKGPAI